MNAFQKPTRRTAMITGAACLALVGALGVGTAAMADGTPTPSASAASGTAQAPAATEGAAAPAAPAAPASGDAAPAAPKHEPHIGGEVQSVSGSTVTVEDPEGFTRTIALADDVAVTKDGADSSVSAIVQGEHIDATGSVADDGTTLDATSVSVGRPTPPKGGPAGGPKGAPAAPPASGPAAPSTDGATPPAAGGSEGSTAPQPSGTPTASAPTTGS